MVHFQGAIQSPCPLRLTSLLSFTLSCVLFSYLLRVYLLWAALVIGPSSYASIGVPANSFQLTRTGNILKRCVCVCVCEVYYFASVSPYFSGKYTYSLHIYWIQCSLQEVCNGSAHPVCVLGPVLFSHLQMPFTPSFVADDSLELL
jgi:hypothetical protein